MYILYSQILMRLNYPKIEWGNEWQHIQSLKTVHSICWGDDKRVYLVIKPLYPVQISFIKQIVGWEEDHQWCLTRNILARNQTWSLGNNISQEYFIFIVMFILVVMYYTDKKTWTVYPCFHLKYTDKNTFFFKEGCYCM